MAAFTTFRDADQEVRALSFILSSLESSKVIGFDSPIERHRPEIAKPLQKIAKILVRKMLDKVAIGVLVKSDKYCTVALDDDVFQLSGEINPEVEDGKKEQVSLSISFVLAALMSCFLG
jgi:hypothetical protein